MKNGKVIALFSTDSSSRVSHENAQFDLGGMVVDKFHGKNEMRSVLVASLDSYNLAKENGIDLHLGEVGENILVDINPYSLDVGQKVQVGEVVLEVTMPCTLCKSLNKVHKGLSNVLKNDRGIFMKVVKEGIVYTDDIVKFL